MSNPSRPIASDPRIRPTSPRPNVPHAATDGDTVIAEVNLPAPPERVFTALTAKGEIERWRGSADTYRMKNWTGEPRVGATIRVDAVMADGGVFPSIGEYLEVDRPRRIVHTRRYEWDFPVLGRRTTTIAYLLDPTPTGTRLSIRHDGFNGMRAPAEDHVRGWEQVLRWLYAYLASETLSIVHDVPIAAAPDAVYEALTTAAGVARWWTPENRVEARVGAVIELTFGSRRFSFRIDELLPGERVVMSGVQVPDEWIAKQLAFRLTPAATGTLVRLSHGGFSPRYEKFGAMNYLWGQRMRSLKLLLETGRGEPFAEGGTVIEP